LFVNISTLSVHVLILCHNSTYSLITIYGILIETLLQLTVPVRVICLSGQITFSPTDASQPFGIISSTTSLTVAEPGINQTTAYAFSKDGLNYILSNAGERASKNKYSATVSSGQIQLHIHNTTLYDEGTYFCSVGPTGDVAFYSLYVEGKH